MTDELFIERVGDTLRKKADTISTARQFEMRERHQGTPLMANQVAGRAAMVAIPETRAHLIQHPRMLSILREVQAKIRNVRSLVIPLRGWRTR